MAQGADRPSLRRLWFLALLLLVSLAAWLFWPAGRPAGPWKAATVAYDPECKKGCEEVETAPFTHLGKISVYVQPKVDDAIAQWGDCLDSVTQCIEAKELTAANIADCVKASTCPSECKSAYAVEAKNASQVKDALDAVERVFIKDDAICLPKEQKR